MKNKPTAVAAGSSVATAGAIWQLTPQMLIRTAKENPKFFRKGLYPDPDKVKALAEVIAPEVTDPDRKWNAAIALLDQNPAWRHSRQSEPISFLIQMPDDATVVDAVALGLRCWWNKRYGGAAQ